MQRGAIQVLLRSQNPLRKKIVWLVYAVILALAIAAITGIVMATQPDDPQPTEPIPTDDDGPPEESLRNLPSHADERNESARLEQIVAYQCHFEPSIKSLSWLEGSDEVVTYRDPVDDSWRTINVTDSSAGSSEPRETTDTEADAPVAPRHMATLWNCPEDNQCRFSAYFSSSAEEAEPSPDSLELVEHLSRLTEGHFGDYTYVNDETHGEGPRRRFGRRSEYKIRLLPERDDRLRNSSGNSCVVRSVDEYRFVWIKGSFEPKHIATVTQRCPGHEIGWTDEYAFEPPDDPRFNLGIPDGSPSGLLEKRGTSGREGLGADLRYSRAGTSSPDGVVVSSPAQESGGTRDELKIHHQQKPDPGRGKLGDSRADYVKIGETGWLLHAILQNRTDGRTIFNLALSRQEAYAELRSMPRAGGSYRPLVNDDVWVTQVLAAPVVGEDEAMAYFIAAPLDDLTQRFLYRVKVVYPPLEYSTLEPVQCLTCIAGDTSAYELSGPGQPPQCSWAEIVVPTTPRRYILKCRGKEVPWNVVVSTDSNLVLRRLDSVTADSRPLHESQVRPVVRDFEVALEGGYRAKARLYLPAGHGECVEKSRLIIVLAEKQNDQLVTAEFDLSLGTYLATVKNYAVLRADVRGSKFNSLDFLELKYRQRELMQIEDYAKVARYVTEGFDCVDGNAGVGVLGEAYGGHVALNLLMAGQGTGFRCAVAIRPFAPWQSYVYPFVKKSSGESIQAFRRKIYKSRYLSALVRRLKNEGADFSLHTAASHDNEDEHFYVDSLLGLLDRQGVEYEHWSYGNDDHHMQCGTRLLLYERVIDYFERCFEKHLHSPPKG